jgi:hypothetical protein
MSEKLISPKNVLLQGVEILSLVLSPKGFKFRFGGTGTASGGDFAWGEFVKGNRRLELHVGRNLGLVRYHIGEDTASHEAYMCQLGANLRRQYPGFRKIQVTPSQDSHAIFLWREIFSMGTVPIFGKPLQERLWTIANGNWIRWRRLSAIRGRLNTCVSDFETKGTSMSSAILTLSRIPSVYRTRNAEWSSSLANESGRSARKIPDSCH